MDNKSSDKTTSPKLIFACSGASDVGELTDRSARLLNKEGAGRMHCLVSICGCLKNFSPEIVQTTSILALDGCSEKCVHKALKKAGFSNHKKLCLTEIGLNKGKSPVSLENLNKITQKAKQLLQE